MNTFAERHKHTLEFAKEAHGNQRYGALPYHYHLLAVQAVALEHSVLNENILIAALLHDILEDTSVTKEELSKHFNNEIVEIVSLVTDITRDPETQILLKNRKERAAFTYPRIRENENAIILKLCDRIANVRESWKATTLKGQSKLGMYKREYGHFRKVLYYESDNTKILWQKLDFFLNWIN